MPAAPPQGKGVPVCRRDCRAFSPALAEEATFYALTEEAIDERSLVDGQLLGSLDVPRNALAFATDALSGRIWVVEKEALSVFDEQGNPLFSTPLFRATTASGVRICLSPTQEGAWLVADASAQRFDTQGNRVATFPLAQGHPVNDIACDPTTNRLWIAHGSRLSQVEPTGVVNEHPLLPEQTAAAVAVGAADGTVALLIVTPQPVLRLYDYLLQAFREIPLPNEGPALERVASLPEGGHWLAGKQRALAVGADGAVSADARFSSGIAQGPGRASVVVNPLDGSAWVGIGSTLLHVAGDGSLTSLPLRHDVIALEATVDGIAPQLEFTAPSSGTVTSANPPTLALTYSDVGSGVDLATLQISREGLPVSTQCNTLGVDTSRCIPEEPLSEGNHTLHAVLADRAGNVSSPAAVSFVIDTLPPAAPAAGSITTEIADGSATLTGAPGAVEPHATLTLLDTRTGESVSVLADADGAFRATIAAEPGDVLQLSAADAAGNLSAAISVTAGRVFDLSITSPAAGEHLPHNRVTVIGRHAGPANSGIVVNGVKAAVDAGGFIAPDVPLGSGTNTLTATLSTLMGDTGTASLEVVGGELSPELLLKASVLEGVSPQEVHFRFDYSGAGKVVSLELDSEGDGTYEVSLPSLESTASYTYTANGTYWPRLRARLEDGTSREASAPLMIHSPEAVDAIFGELWSRLTADLTAANPSSALRYLDESVRHSYEYTFQVMVPHMQEFIASCSEPARASASDGYLEYVVVREIDGRQKAFLIYSAKGADGVWRIHSM